MKPIGIFGNYVLSEDFESKRFFLRKEERNAQGELEVKTFPMQKCKKYLQLQHSCGDIVCFASYLYQGAIRYKDSRFPRKSFDTDSHVVSEICRMTGIDEEKARSLIKLF